jgi:hypothetical protein
LIPRVTRVAGFEWGTGFYINPMEPERATAFMRGVSEEELAAGHRKDDAPIALEAQDSLMIEP